MKKHWVSVLLRQLLASLLGSIIWGLVVLPLVGEFVSFNAAGSVTAGGLLGLVILALVSAIPGFFIMVYLYFRGGLRKIEFLEEYGARTYDRELDLRFIWKDAEQRMALLVYAALAALPVLLALLGVTTTGMAFVGDMAPGIFAAQLSWMGVPGALGGFLLAMALYIAVWHVVLTRAHAKWCRLRLDPVEAAEPPAVRVPGRAVWMSITAGAVALAVGLTALGAVLLGGASSVAEARLRVTAASIGNPLLARWPDDAVSRNIWDMRLFEGRLYVGCGDYDRNTGPVEVWAYDLAAKQWVREAELDDEQISRFVELDGELVIPGTDPKEGVYDWEFGNYYVRREGGWETVNTIPNGVCNFDMAAFDGALFAGLDRNGASPAVRSDDGGKTWTAVSMIREGAQVGQGAYMARIFDYVVLNNTLYAYYVEAAQEGQHGVCSIYRYEEGVFRFFSTAAGFQPFVGESYMLMGGKAVFHNEVYMAVGELLVSKDMVTFSCLDMPMDLMAWDVVVAEDQLLMLANFKLDNGKFRNIVCKKTGGNFEEILWFDDELPARSFVYGDGVFFFGMGGMTSEGDRVGTVMRVEKKI